MRGLTGFGMAILLVPILALALPPVEAVVLGNCLSLLIGLTEVRMLVREAERSAWVIGAAVVLTTAAGPMGAVAPPPEPMSRGWVIALIAFSAFLAILLPRRGSGMPGAAGDGQCRGAERVDDRLCRDARAAGGFPNYAGRALPRITIKASMLLIFTIAAAAGLASATWLSILRWELVVFALLLLPVILTGNWLGLAVSGRISDPIWRSVVGLVLGGAALGALVRAYLAQKGRGCRARISAAAQPTTITLRAQSTGSEAGKSSGGSGGPRHRGGWGRSHVVMLRTIVPTC